LFIFNFFFLSPDANFRDKVDLYDFINHASLGSPKSDTAGRTGSSTWGWTDPESGREFIGEMPN
jgi:hypothetical protein